MSLPDFIGAKFDGPLSAVRRQTIALVIACAGSVGAIFYSLTAAHLALVPLIGEIGARLVTAGGCVAIAGFALILPRLLHMLGGTERARGETDALTREQKIAMIVEALLMGYAISTRQKSARERK